MNTQYKKLKGLYIKDESAIKFVKYIQVISIIVVIAVFAYTGFLSMMLKVSFSQLISENMTVVCGFIMAVASLFTYYLAKQYIHDFEAYSNIEGNRFKLLMITIFNACFANLVTLIFGILALVKIYQWKDVFSFNEMMQGIKKENQLSICMGVFVIFAILFALQITIGSLVME